MKHFKDNENNIYAFEKDGSQDHLIGDHLKPISDKELNSLLKEKANNFVVKEKVTQQRLIEAILGIDNGWLQNYYDNNLKPAKKKGK
jgi:hypothetical protein